MKRLNKHGLLTQLPLVCLAIAQVWYRPLTHILLTYIALFLTYDSGRITGRVHKGTAPLIILLIPLAGLVTILVDHFLTQSLILISMSIVQNLCQRLTIPPLDKKSMRLETLKSILIIGILGWTMTMNMWPAWLQVTQTTSPTPATQAPAIAIPN